MSFINKNKGLIIAGSFVAYYAITSFYKNIKRKKYMEKIKQKPYLAKIPMSYGIELPQNLDELVCENKNPAIKLFGDFDIPKIINKKDMIVPEFKH